MQKQTPYWCCSSFYYLARKYFHTFSPWYWLLNLTKLKKLWEFLKPFLWFAFLDQTHFCSFIRLEVVAVQNEHPHLPMCENLTNQLLRYHSFLFSCVSWHIILIAVFFNPWQNIVLIEGFQMLKALNPSMKILQWKSCSEERTWFKKLSWKKTTKKIQRQDQFFTWEGFTNQCLIRWPGWIMSQEVIRHMDSFIFHLFLLSGI